MGVKNIQFEPGYIVITFDNGNVARHPLTDLLTAGDIPDIDAAKITTGAFHVDRVPNLNADKINAGAFATARIPALSANKITSDSFGVDRIPGLSAAKITSGTFATTRIADGAITHPKLFSPDTPYVGVYDRAEYGRSVYGA